MNLNDPKYADALAKRYSDLRDKISRILTKDMESFERGSEDEAMELMAHWTILIGMGEAGMIQARVPNHVKQEIRRLARGVSEMWSLQFDLSRVPEKEKRRDEGHTR